MTDSTHNTLVTTMIIIAVLIAIVLLTRGLSPLAYRYREYQGASAIQLLPQNNQNYQYTQPRYSQTVTSYSRPSQYVNPTTTYYSDTSYTYDTVYTYECSPDGSYCWTNQ